MNPTATDRDQAIATIRTNLRRRGLKWISVKGGRGTAWGWITICAMPSKGANTSGDLTPDQQVELTNALGLDSVSRQGESIPASSAYRQEYIDRSAGRTPSQIGTPYWD